MMKIDNLSVTNDDAIIYTVSEIAQMTSDLLQECFSTIWLTGEVSNVSMPASGHCYFTLKDQHAQLRVVIFRANLSHKDSITPGITVTIQGQMNVYEPRGDLQLIARKIHIGQDGHLLAQFEKIKAYCTQRGWFLTTHKKIVPVIKTLGVITSATGAAVHDVLKVLSRRDPTMRVIIYPSQVQGDQAAKQLVAAIATAQAHNRVDALLITRGGGSSEDLFCFNSVEVVKAVYQCGLPVISAVGHEVDTTLIDFVADLRAATPSAGAELVSTDQSHLLLQLAACEKSLNFIIKSRFEKLQQQLQVIAMKCISPKDKIIQLNQQLDNLLLRLINTLQEQMRKLFYQLDLASNKLEALDPMKVLDRGFMIASDAKTGKVITHVSCFSDHQCIKLRSKNASVTALITGKSHNMDV